MKFIVSTTSLLRNLQLVNGVVNTNTVLPILEDFLFVIEKNKLTISGTDLETSIATTMEIESKANGKVAIPAKILVEYLKTLPEQPLTISIDDESFAVEITTDRGKYKLNGETGSDFPRIPAADNVEELTLSTAVLQKAINKTIFAVSNDELRPQMTGVYFQLNNEGITFVATDAHKLVKYKRTDVQAVSSTSFIVPKKALTLLKSILPSEDTQVKISYNSSNAFFKYNNVSLICRLIDAKYPDYNAVIPTENPNQLNLNRADILNTLRRVMIFSNKTTHQVILKINGNQLNVQAQDLDFSNEANEILDCQYSGADMEIGFNAKFLSEMLSAMDNEEVKLELSTPTRAGILLPTETESGEDLLMLVMPVMLSV
ncbi:MAG: DNA polymerase III subunit beta [Fimbriimonadaceae bacterium]|nr:DNA polymerase III subunit beta [Chitinophagales bacterium]